MMSGAELPALMAAMGANGAGAAGAAAGASGIPGGIAGLFGAGAASPMATSLLGPAAATPFVTGLPAAGIGGGSAASSFGPAATSGLAQMMAPAPLGLGAPPAAGKSLLGLLSKGANAAASMDDGQQAPPPAPLPQQNQDVEQFAALFDKYMSGLDPVSKRMLMSRMRGV